ncbi:hypothetical protein [Sphingosinicella sp.]|uniref:hypothetical protein n=1 Tax=Sphingosinicella sp. TaxID=1917971 RepID=UPI00184E1B4C|nr:hypothetical protein [Sphingosinicella sp.]MBA4759163.1 hypothetical protein [Sphingosinicella sp.]
MVDWWSSGPQMVRLWRMSMETWSASMVVIAERSAMMGNAAMFPTARDVQEFGRMVPEKMDAFTRSMMGAARARDPIEAAENALAPVHARVTSNARRLRRR